MMKSFLKKLLAAAIVAAMAAQVVSVSAAAAADDLSVKAPDPYGPLPNAMQLQYHQEELSAFCHFGMNTFTNKEWGDGTEKEEWFNPTGFHPEEWVKQLQDAGFKRLIITAKHHDGFCIWPSEYTEHDVANSPYKDGKGDILAEISKVCTDLNMDMGLYLSPWDANAPSYGYFDKDGNPLVGSNGQPLNGMTWEQVEELDVLDYNEYYINQIKEIANNPIYGNNGRFVEWWMDGAKGTGAAAQNYRMDDFLATIRECEPDVQIFGGGNSGGIHWIGNENGIAPDETWAQRGEYWSVPECDVSLISGWFWHPNYPAKSMEQMANIYFSSVGHGAPLLLNVPPNRDGRYDQAHANRIAEFGQAIEETFDEDLTQKEGVTATASAVRGNAAQFDASKTIDGKEDTYWTMDDGQLTGSVTVNLGKEQTFDVVSIEEYIELGQRISSFKVEYRSGNGEWKDFGSGKTISAKRLVRRSPVKADQVRVTITGSKAVPLLRTIGVYKAAKGFEVSSPFPDDLTLIDNPSFNRNGTWNDESGSFINNTGMWCNAGASASFTFTGTQAWIIGTVDPNHGVMTVQIDDMDPVDVNTQSSTRKLQQILYTTPELEDGPHTVTMTCKTKALGLDAAYVLDNGGAGMFELDKANYTVNEGGSVDITINRVSGSKGEATLLISTPPGKAVQGQYYVDINETLTFAEGETSKTVTVQTIDNNVKTGSLNFFFELTSSTGAIIGFTPRAEIIIIDDEMAQDLQDAIAQADALIEAHYLPDSWAAMLTAKAHAQNVLENSSSMSETQIDAATNGLLSAIEALVKRTNYTAEDPFMFPGRNDEAKLLEAEFFDMHPAVDDNKHIHVTEKAEASNGKEVNWFMSGDSMSVPYRALAAGTYDVTMTYRSGRLNEATGNVITWSGDNVESGSVKVFGEANANQYHTVTFTIKVTEAGRSVLNIGTTDSEGPVIDKFEVAPKELELATFYINATAGEGGTIEPSGEVPVEQFSSKTFTIKPDADHSLGTVKVNGQSVGEVDSYTFENIQGDATIEATFDKNIAKKAVVVTASNQHSATYSGDKAVDGKSDTRWATQDSVTKEAWLELSFAEPVTVDTAYFSQLTGANNRTNAYNIEYWADNEWKIGYTGGSIGSTATVRFEAFTADRIRFHITDGFRPSFWEFQLYNEKRPSKSVQDVANELTMQNPDKGAAKITMPVVPGGFAIELTATSNFNVIDTFGNINAPAEPTDVDLTFTVSKDGESASKTLTVTVLPNSVKGDNLSPTATNVTASNFHSAPYSPDKATDGNASTRWATNDSVTTAWLMMEFDAPITIGSAYIKEMNSANNHIDGYNIEYWVEDATARDGETGHWEVAYTGGAVNGETNVSFASVTSNKIRLNLTNANRPSIYEFQVFEETPVPPVEVADRTIINKVIEKATALKDSEEFANAISSVQESFLAALDEAIRVANTNTSTPEQVQNAWVALMTEIHKLGLQQGNKDLLREHYELYSQLDLDLYIDDAAKTNFITALENAAAMLENNDAVQSEVDAVDNALVAAADALTKRGDKTSLQTLVDQSASYVEENYAKGWAEFEAALEKANIVLDNANATQDDVNVAVDELLTAMLNLRFKADKTLLNNAIAAAEALDLSGFSAESVEAFNASLAAAKATAADDSLSEEEQNIVDKALSDLNEAVKGLTKTNGTSANLEINGDGSIVKTTSGAKTGESAPLALAVATLLLAGAAVSFGKKRRSK